MKIKIQPRLQLETWSLYWKQPSKTDTRCLEAIMLEVDDGGPDTTVSTLMNQVQPQNLLPQQWPGSHVSMPRWRTFYFPAEPEGIHRIHRSSTIILQTLLPLCTVVMLPCHISASPYPDCSRLPCQQMASRTINLQMVHAVGSSKNTITWPLTTGA